MAYGGGIGDGKTEQFSWVLAVFYALMKMGQECVNLVKLTELYTSFHFTHFTLCKVYSNTKEGQMMSNGLTWVALVKHDVVHLKL